MNQNTPNNLNIERKVNENYAIVIPAGKWHNLTNIGNIPIKLYSIQASKHRVKNGHTDSRMRLNQDCRGPEYNPKGL